MSLSFLNAPEQNIDMTTQFGGYNHQLNLSENEFYDMKNMSPRNFPMASTRKKRGIFSNDMLKSANAIVSKDNIVFSFTGEGNIGVTLEEDVFEKAWVDPPAYDDVETVGETVVAGYNQNEVTKDILDTNNNVNNFDKYIYNNGEMSVLTGSFNAEIKDGNVIVKWNHQEIPKGTLWAKKLLKVKYVYKRDDTWVGDGDKTIIATDELSYSSATKHQRLKDIEVWVNNQKVKIIEIEKGGILWAQGKYKVVLDLVGSDNPPSIKTGDEIYIRLTEPTESEIPARRLEDIDNAIINPPTKVKVQAISDSHLKVLKGQTINFGGQECYISGYEIDGDNRYLLIGVPHGAINKGATATGERLFLCEYNPFTGDSTVSDVFTAAQGEHRLIEMGGYVVVFPEKVMINTQKRVGGVFTDIQPLEMSDVLEKCTLKLTDVSGNGYDKCEVGNTAPETPSNGTAWIDTSANPPELKVYSSQIEQWAKTQPYCEIRVDDGSVGSISNEWKIGDAVELKFDDESIIGETIVPITDQKYFVISATEDKDKNKCLRFPVSMKTASATTEQRLVITRTVPDMDFVIENENRLWGCKYGEVDGEPINEIFACKLGDPKNWHYFANTSMDSYYVSLGADGEFTGAISYAGNPFFFRENCIHRVYGNYPSNYALKTVYCHGVEKGSEKGITVMNDVMFYKSPIGIMAYTGASPVHISRQFGDVIYKNAVAGAVGNKMYFSMQDQKGNNVFFSYDDITKMWYKEDDFRCKEMVVYENDVYALSSNNDLVVMNSEALETSDIMVMEDDFEWSLTSGNIGYNTPFYKHIARLNIRMNLERTARANIYIQYNSDGNWHKISSLDAKGRVINMSVPVNPQRCDHFALKIDGKGEIQIYSITKFVEGGSENE